MFKKLMAASLSLLAVVMIMATGCDKKPSASNTTTKAQPESKEIYFVVKASESDFWQIVIDGGRTAANKLNVTFTDQAPSKESDIERQIAIIDNAIVAQPAAIVLAPSDAKSLVRPIKEAVEAGIPVILIDSGVESDDYTSFLASDNVRIGEIAADKMAEALIKSKGAAKGKVVGIGFATGAASLDKRKAGFVNQLKAKYPDIELIDFLDAGGKTNATIGIVENLLTRYEDLDGIYASNQYTGDETAKALKTANRLDLAVVVVDAGTQEVEGLTVGTVDYVISQRPWKMGYMGVEYAIKAANGEKLEKIVDTGVVAITKEMVESGAAEEFLNPVEFNKKKATK